MSYVEYFIGVLMVNRSELGFRVNYGPDADKKLGRVSVTEVVFQMRFHK